MYALPRNVAFPDGSWPRFSVAVDAPAATVNDRVVVCAPTVVVTLTHWIIAGTDVSASSTPPVASPSGVASPAPPPGGMSSAIPQPEKKNAAHTPASETLRI